MCESDDDGDCDAVDVESGRDDDDDNNDSRDHDFITDGSGEVSSYPADDGRRPEIRYHEDYDFIGRSVLDFFGLIRRSDLDVSALTTTADGAAPSKTPSSSTAGGSAPYTVAVTSATTKLSSTASTSYKYDKFAVHPLGAVGSGAFTKSRAEPICGRGTVPHMEPRAPVADACSSLERFIQVRRGQEETMMDSSVPTHLDGLREGSDCCSLDWCSALEC